MAIIGLVLIFLIAGLSISWVFQIKPMIENRKTITDFYEGKK